MITRKLILMLLSFLIAGSMMIVRQPEGVSAAGRPSRIIPDHYIVFFTDKVTDTHTAISKMSRRYGLTVHYEYDALNGFAGVIPPARLDEVSNDPRVLSLGPDFTLEALGQGTSTGLRRIGGSSDGQTQTLKLKGSGIGIAVLDTGIDPNQSDLAPYSPGKSCIKGTRSADDDNGHGTMVAGIIAAQQNNIGVVGVAPEADLISVKILDMSGNGTGKQTVCGINWVKANAKNRDGSQRIHIVNMSTAGKAVVPIQPSRGDCTNGPNPKKTSDQLHTAICLAVKDSNVTFVVGAGNNNQDAGTYVPAAYGDPTMGGEVITVSALADSDGKPEHQGDTVGCGSFDNIMSGLGRPTPAFALDDAFAPFSNFGAAVTIAAPGVCIRTTFNGGGYGDFSGTSASTPFVAGAAALFKEAHPTATPDQVKAGLVAVWERGPIAGDPDTFAEGVLRLAAPQVYVTVAAVPSQGAPPRILVMDPSGGVIDGIILDQATTPRSVATANGYLYVADYNVNNPRILVYNAAPPYSLVRIIALPNPPGPWGVWVAASPDGKFIYAAGYGSAGFEIETTNNTISRSFSVPKPTCLPSSPPTTLDESAGWYTARVAVNPITQEAWFTGEGFCKPSVGDTVPQAYIVRFGGSPMSLEGGFDGARETGAIAITSTGTTYLASFSCDGTACWGIQRDPGGGVATVVGWDIALTPDDATLYITDVGNLNVLPGNVYVLDTGTNLLTPIGMPIDAHPRGVALSPDGTRAFVSDYLGGMFYVINTATHIVSSTSVGIGIQNGVAVGLIPLF